MRWSGPCHEFSKVPRAPRKILRPRRLVGLYRGPLNAGVRRQPPAGERS
jgi:hypothetical protein